MSLNKLPSFVSVDEERGKVKVAFLLPWYNDERCSECPCFNHIATGNTDVGYCEEIEKDEPCKVTGIRHNVGKTK